MSRPRAAIGSFPYNHRTVAEMDAIAARRNANASVPDAFKAYDRNLYVQGYTRAERQAFIAELIAKDAARAGQHA